jgi:hypothetical protein
MSLASTRIVRSRRRVTPQSILKTIELAERLGYTEEQELLAKANRAQMKVNFRLAEIRRQRDRNEARMIKMRERDGEKW